MSLQLFGEERVVLMAWCNGCDSSQLSHRRHVAEKRAWNFLGTRAQSKRVSRPSCTAWECKKLLRRESGVTVWSKVWQDTTWLTAETSCGEGGGVNG